MEVVEEFADERLVARARLGARREHQLRKHARASQRAHSCREFFSTPPHEDPN